MTRATERDWTFGGTWPYDPLWFDTPDGRLHFVDVGPRDGQPVVLVHGNPTWGYLYRHFIPPLVAAGHRVIVPDHLGFGRSDKPPAGASHHVERHAGRLGALLDSLDLQAATLVVHDWGGPLALAWAVRRAARVSGLVILNTFLPPPHRRVALPLPLRLFRLPVVGEILVKRCHAIVRGFLFGAGVRLPARLGPEVRAAYLAAHPRAKARAAILALARAFPAGPAGPVAAFQAGVHASLPALAGRPVLIAWGDEDVVFPRATLDQWRTDFPAADVHTLPGVGHFLQEDAHEIIIPLLMAFLDRVRNPRPCDASVTMR